MRDKNLDQLEVHRWGSFAKKRMSSLSAQLWCSCWLKAEQLHPERSPHQSILQPSSQGIAWEKGDTGSGLCFPSEGTMGFKPRSLISMVSSIWIFWKKKWIFQVQGTKYHESSQTLVRSGAAFPFSSALLSKVLWSFPNKGLFSLWAGKISPGKVPHYQWVLLTSMITHTACTFGQWGWCSSLQSRATLGSLWGDRGKSSRKPEFKQTKSCIYALPV